MQQQAQEISVVFTGHVDHGKSTIIGQLLQQLGYVRKERLDQLRAFCEKNQKPFELAFLLDAFSDERDQNVTIDAARARIRINSSFVTLIDAPGHRDFVRNMITGATRADTALLVLDAGEGIRENTRRHAHLLALLGFREVIAVINKMDLVGYSPGVYRELVADLQQFFRQINLHLCGAVPVSGKYGDGITGPSEKLGWYAGKPLAGILEELQPRAVRGEEAALPLRMPVQDVFRPKNGAHETNGTKRRVLGSVVTGRLRRGDELLLLPSGRKTKALELEQFPGGSVAEACAGEAVAVIIEDDLYINRGELISSTTMDAPKVSTRFRSNIIWFGEQPLDLGTELTLQLGTERVNARVEQIAQSQDLSDLSIISAPSAVGRNEVASCVLRLTRAIAADEATSGMIQTARFVISTGGRISGAGSIQQALGHAWSGDRLVRRHLKWEQSLITGRERAQRFGQKPALILITGPASSERKELAKLIEATLFGAGRATYFLALGSLIYGLDADLPKDEGVASEGPAREEHMRRLAELGRMLLEAGLIMIVSALELRDADIEELRLLIDAERIISVWYGEQPTGRSFDLTVSGQLDPAGAVGPVAELLESKGLVFKA